MAKTSRAVVVAPEDDSYASRIRSKYDSFTKSQKKIAEYLSGNPNDVLTNSITALAKKIGTTSSSLTRFCQLLHYQGFTDLRFCMDKMVSSPFSHGSEVQLDDKTDAVRKKLLHMQVKAISDTLLLIDNKQVNQAAGAIRNARHVIVYADGGNGSTASYAYHAFLQLGISCNAFSDCHLAKIAEISLTDSDVAIGITFSGQAVTVIEVMEEAARRGAQTIGITAFSNSTLARMASIPLCYSINIGDDIRYLHIGRMCEISIIGLIQSVLINSMPRHVLANIERSKKAIASFRKR